MINLNTDPMCNNVSNMFLHGWHISIVVLCSVVLPLRLGNCLTKICHLVQDSLFWWQESFHGVWVPKSCCGHHWLNYHNIIKLPFTVLSEVRFLFCYMLYPSWCQQAMWSWKRGEMVKCFLSCWIAPLQSDLSPSSKINHLTSTSALSFGVFNWLFSYLVWHHPTQSSRQLTQQLNELSVFC